MLVCDVYVTLFCETTVLVQHVLYFCIMLLPQDKPQWTTHSPEANRYTPEADLTHNCVINGKTTSTKPVFEMASSLLARLDGFCVLFVSWVPDNIQSYGFYAAFLLPISSMTSRHYLLFNCCSCRESQCQHPFVCFICALQDFVDNIIECFSLCMHLSDNPMQFCCF